jgi:ElaA protein
MPAWKWTTFEELTNSQLYDILQMRELVYTIGQNCDEADMDGVDKSALHLFSYHNDELLAYLRVYQKDGKYKIGRVIVNPEYQGKGFGREMMVEAVRYVKENFPGEAVEMSAQHHLEKFYHSVGFKTISDVYIEAGIDHVRMSLES